MGFSTSSSIPAIHLLCMEDQYIAAFNSAKETYKLPTSVTITIHHERLAELGPNVQFDAIVSPANSYARLDGGFDHALSRAFAPKHNYDALTRVAQAAVYKEYRGFAPPGSCLLINLEGEESLEPNSWGCKYLALCPTMKVPQNVKWDREVVYECIWTLLAAIDRHNRQTPERESREESGGSDGGIRSVLMTPLATGCGDWSPQRWAAQTVIAIRHFVDAVENEEEWKKLNWRKIGEQSDEVKKTHKL